MNPACGDKQVFSPELRKALSASWTGAIHWDVAMAGYCTFRAGGRAEALLVPANRRELASLMQWLHRHGVPWRVIGRGSNILVQGRGYRGAVIVLGGDFSTADLQVDPGEDSSARQVRAGAGCSSAALVNWCSGHELSGLEFMVGIPGTVGGAVRMNAGAWGQEIGSLVESVAYIDNEGAIHDAGADKILWRYRDMQLRQGALDDAILIEVVLRLRPGRKEEMIALCREYLEKRRAKQPLGVASAGSFFKNPPGDWAGRLIEEAGLKGLSRGGAMVSEKHANFIVNSGGATPDDIIGLMKEVQEKVYRRSGVMLEPEVHLL